MTRVDWTADARDRLADHSRLRSATRARTAGAASGEVKLFGARVVRLVEPGRGRRGTGHRRRRHDGRMWNGRGVDRERPPGREAPDHPAGVGSRTRHQPRRATILVGMPGADQDHRSPGGGGGSGVAVLRRWRCDRRACRGGRDLRRHSRRRPARSGIRSPNVASRRARPAMGPRARLRHAAASRSARRLSRRAAIRGGAVRLDADLLDLLRLGAAQLLHMESVPAYAAIAQTVELAKRRHGIGASKLANAVLRRLDRERDALTLPRPSDPIDALALDGFASAMDRRALGRAFRRGRDAQAARREQSRSTARRAAVPRGARTARGDARVGGHSGRATRRSRATASCCRARCRRSPSSDRSGRGCFTFRIPRRRSSRSTRAFRRARSSPTSARPRAESRSSCRAAPVAGLRERPVVRATAARASRTPSGWRSTRFTPTSPTRAIRRSRRSISCSSTRRAPERERSAGIPMRGGGSRSPTSR